MDTMDSKVALIRSGIQTAAERLTAHMRAGTFGHRVEAAVRTYSGTSRVLFTHSYTGEKNLGELGPAREYIPMYQLLRTRSWQAMLESEVVQTIVNRLCTWVIGDGLRLQSEPNREVLKSEGITIDPQAFSKLVEARFQTWAESKESDHSKFDCLNFMEKEAYKNAIIGGDFIFILRLKDGRVTVQIIDGAHVQSPMPGYGDEILAQVLDNGNTIIHGVERNAQGEHVAYHVVKAGTLFETERIPVKGSEAGLTMARLVYGSRHRIDSVRGMPVMSVILESVKKLERYREATVGSAEEQAKIAFTIEHKEGSDGSSPLAKQLARAAGMDPNSDLPKTDDGQVLADRIAASVNKQVFNLGVNQTLKTMEKSKDQLYFKDFYGVNFEISCACVEVPPNVVAQKYETSFSSARAALKDWEHTLRVKRSDFSRQFKQVIYEFWLEVQILMGKIPNPSAMDYINARLSDNFMAVAAFRSARWIGANVPHIDPLKEVEAVRLKLGDTAAAMPLITFEQATEELNGGTSDDNMEQFAQELERSKKLGIEIPQPEPAAIPA
jgi:capsid protein